MCIKTDKMAHITIITPVEACAFNIVISFFG